MKGHLDVPAARHLRLPITDGNRRWWIVAAMALPLFISNVDFFGVGVALPALGRDLHGSTATLQWVVNAFGLAFAAPLVAAGRLGDLRGRRLVLLIGLVVYAVASAFSGAAPNDVVMIAARAAQGLGAALFFVNALSIVSSAFPPAQRYLGLAVWSGAGAVGMSLGPLVAGALTDSLSWRWFFWLNIPLSLAAIALTLLVVQESKASDANPRLDVPGFVTLTGGLVLVVLAMQQGETSGWTSPLIVGSAAGGVLLLALFVGIERRVASPLLELRLFAGRSFLLASGISVLANYGFGALIVILTLYLQHARGYSALGAGVVFLGLAVPYAALSPFVGRVVTTLGIRLPLIAGMAMIALAFGALVFVGPASRVELIVVALVIFGVGQAFAYNVAGAAAMAAIPDTEAGAASGVLNTLRELGPVIGVAVTGVVFRDVENARLAALLSSSIGLPDQVEPGEVAGLLSGSPAAQTELVSLAAGTVTDIDAITREALAAGFDGAMRFAFVVGVVGLVTALFIPKGGDPTRGARLFHPVRFVPLLGAMVDRRRDRDASRVPVRESVRQGGAGVERTGSARPGAAATRSGGDGPDGDDRGRPRQRDPSPHRPDGPGRGRLDHASEPFPHG